ncbi:MAG: DNA repair protein RadA [Candidatus Delongbacteria bacterium]|jgi:DNA repair protein RadA/Sms|nr:DNA repair protein RadA [Candidatus Delongbacteria bacterium]MDD4204926.1 DNA repair protein RadA [Candidatus Delongbacteria bacterium]MDY0017914.1 DNA repair protein RadA [Candidatus Delongbacteria bacterium]
MAKNPKTNFVCTECGYDTPKWLGKCPSCGVWGSLKEFRESKQGNSPVYTGAAAEPVSLKDIRMEESKRYLSGITELDRVLGGGCISGMAALVGGDPGIGKSTLMLKYISNLQSQGLKTLYVSGEESPHQIKSRAERIGADAGDVCIFCENDVRAVLDWIEKNRPDIVVIDSVQTVCDPSDDSSPGSPGQVRTTAARIITAAKKLGFCVFIVGHVTKEGFIAGPKMIEHMVDAVLYFEGDRFHGFRILRTVKNRYGSTNEIGLFEMRPEGLAEVTNPSSYFLNETTLDAPGASIAATLEGTRPLLIEIQALVTSPSFGNPQRNCVGFDIKRLSKIIAVLDRKIGLNIAGQDIFLNVTGGAKLTDPGADVSVAVSLISSFRNFTVPPKSVFFGEVGLNGEIRPVSGSESRISESKKLGFKNIYSSSNVKDLAELVSLII